MYCSEKKFESLNIDICNSDKYMGNRKTIEKMKSNKEVHPILNFDQRKLNEPMK